MTRQRKVWLSIGVLGSLVLLAVYLFSVAGASKPVKKARIKMATRKAVKRKPAPSEPEAICPLQGVPTTTALAGRRPLAVMVENLSTIRPQSGLSQACLVVEGLTEGGITRFMVVFGHTDAPDLGPVRSARTHFVAMADGLRAAYGHAGGSTVAMAAIKSWGIFDLDHGPNAGSYRRIPGVRAPHNLFTTPANLRARAETKFPGFSGYEGFKFGREPALANRPATQTVTIDFSQPDYAVRWVYDRQTNGYKRFNGGRAHTDANNQAQLEAKNILIMYAPTAPIPRTPLLDVNVIGLGRLTAVMNGRTIEGQWSKASSDNHLELRTAAGTALELTPGQVWLEIVPTTAPVTIN